MDRIRLYLLTVAGAERTARRNLQLASLLAFSAGALNALGFVAVSVYTSHMTGLAAGVSAQLVLGDLHVIATGLTGLGCFVAGAATCALLVTWGRRRQLEGRYACVLALEAVLVLLFGLLAGQLAWGRREFVFIAVLCFTMGMQNAIITKISHAQIRTTHITGMVTDLGIELGKLVYRHRDAALGPVRADRHKLGMLSLLVGLFFVGGLLGALGFLTFGFAAVVPLSLCLLAGAAGPLLTDLRALGASRRA